MSEQQLQTTCVFIVRPTSFYGKLPTHKCGKAAVVVDSNGRPLCKHHYNRWLKKILKSKDHAAK